MTRVTGPIVLVAPNYHPRTCGVGDNSMRIAEELQRRGWKAVVLSREPAERHPESPSIESRGIAGARPLAVARRLLPEIERLRPALVVLQYTPQMLGGSRFGSPGMPWLASRLRRRGVRVIAVAHELFIDWSWRPDLALGAALQRLYLVWLMHAVHRLAVTTSTRLDFPVIRWFGSGDRKPGLIRIGSNALPAPAPVRRSGRRLGAFSTFGVGKRLDVVVGGFARLALLYPDLELVIIGDLGEGSARYRQLLHGIREASGSSRVRVTGKLPLSRVAEEVADCEAFLFPMNTGATTRSSTLPLAFASGLPVVAIHGSETDDGLFVADQNVVFASALDAESFAAATRRVLDDPGLAQRVGRGGRRLFDEHLQWSRIVDELLALGGVASGPDTTLHAS